MIEESYTFPEILKDDEFKESFSGDVQTSAAQFESALKKTAHNPNEAMVEAMRAMHMLRGAAGVIGYDLVMHFAEMNHRLAEVAMSFAQHRQDDYDQIIGFLERARSVLTQVVASLKTEDIGAVLASYQDMVTAVQPLFGDYFIESESVLEMEVAPKKEDEGLQELIASVESAEEVNARQEEAQTPPEQTEVPASAVQTVGANIDSFHYEIDEPAEWDVLQYFYQEIDENLDAFEQTFLKLEKGSDQGKGITELLRLAHSTKGAANSMGMFRIAKLMHEFEDFYEAKQATKKAISSESISASLHCCDLIKEVLLEVKAAKSTEGLSERLQQAVTRLHAEVVVTPKFTKVVESGIDSVETVSTPGELTMQEAQPITELTEDNAGTNQTAQTFRIDAAKIDALMNLVGELIISRTRVTQHIQQLLGLSQELAKARSRMNETLDSFAERFEYTNRTQSSKKTASETADPDKAVTDIQEFSSLEFDQYDDFNVLSRQVSEIGNDTDLTVRQLINGMQELNLEASTLGRFVSDIQDGISSSRLVPIGTLFKRLERAVRDAADKEHKQVTMLTEGSELLLDKTIIDDLFNPLVHLVRNSVAHGFSVSPNQENIIRIAATQEGGRARFTVVDNGSGIDLKKVKAVGVAKGLIRESNEDVSAITDLVFKEGFSTADQVTEVAGRGIGLDAVKDTIERMNGFISVGSSESVGCKFSIDLPLTLAIDRGIYFTIGSSRYAVLMSQVEQVLFTSSAQIEQVGDKEIIMIGEEPVPLINLHELFYGASDGDADVGAIMICRYLENRVAVKVSRIERQEDIVVKPLGKLLEGHRFFGSATVDGSGEVIPIIDVGRLPMQTEGISSGPQFSEFSGLVEEGSKPKILIVDDSVSVRKICEDYLSGQGYHIETANDGIKALNAIRLADYDLIFTDLEMPRLNGLELIAELRRRPATEHTPIVVITSRSTDKHAQKAKSLGASDYISKPFSRDSLLEVVEQYVQVEA